MVDPVDDGCACRSLAIFSEMRWQVIFNPPHPHCRSNLTSCEEFRTDGSDFVCVEKISGSFLTSFPARNALIIIRAYSKTRSAVNGRPKFNISVKQGDEIPYKMSPFVRSSSE